MIFKNIGNLTEISSENGYIHIVGTDMYFKKGIMIHSADQYEEVDTMPNYTRAEYESKVQELIKEKYSIEDEMCIQRKMLNASRTPTALSNDSYVSEFIEYNTYVEECKTRAKQILTYGEES